MRTFSTLLFSAIVFSASAVFGTPIIDVGVYSLLPDVENQDPIEIRVSGTEDVQGLNFRIQIADGYSDVPGSAIDGPNITAVDIVSGTIFDGNNTGQQDVEHRDQTWDQQITTQSSTVVADGLLARVWFDTRGFDTVGQQWDLILTGGFLGDTNFGLIEATVSNGTLIIPEPHAVALVAISCLTLLGIRVRHRNMLSA